MSKKRQFPSCGLLLIGAIFGLFSQPRAFGINERPTARVLWNMQTCCNGTRISFAVSPVYERASPQDELWMLNLKSGEAKKAFQGYLGLLPSIAPDGRRAAYSVSDPDEKGRYLVKIADFEKRSSYAIAREQTISIPQWSPDGKRIGFTTVRAGNDYYVRIVDPDGFLPDQFSSLPLSDKLAWAWHPSGKQMLYSTGIGDDGRIIMIDLEAQTENVIAKGHSIEFSPPLSLTFSPDGDSFFFVEPDVCSLQLRPRICSIDTKTVRELEAPGGDYIKARWSRDGKKIAGIFEVGRHNSVEGEHYLFIWDVLTEETTLRHVHEELEVEWLPESHIVLNDGERLYVLSYDGKEWRETKELYKLSDAE